MSGPVPRGAPGKPFACFQTHVPSRRASRADIWVLENAEIELYGVVVAPDPAIGAQRARCRRNHDVRYANFSAKHSAASHTEGTG
jgi:hypothetical protein